METESHTLNPHEDDGVLNTQAVASNKTTKHLAQPDKYCVQERTNKRITCRAVWDQ